MAMPYKIAEPLSTSQTDSTNQNSNATTQEINETLNLENQKKREKKSVSFPFGKCRICHDNATGVHYGVITCEGCKGFFKRSITQGIPYRCFFGDRCVINMETRNRCKACRFKRCVQQGMAIESVKMGRIPKKLKEKALHDYQKQQERRSEEYSKENASGESFDEHDDDLMDMNASNRSSVFDEKRPSISSLSSLSSSNSSSHNQRISTDSHDDIIVIPKNILHGLEESPMRTVDLIELTISASNDYVDNLNNNLSSLRLPSVFYECHHSSPTFTDDRVSPKKNQEAANEISRPDESANNSNRLTVSTYVSKLSEKPLVDYMFGCEIRYAKNVLQIMKYLAPKLSQPFFIYELDFEVSSFFRYIRWKMFNFYLKHSKRVRSCIERMFGIINLGITDYPGSNATREQMWEAVQASIPSHVDELIAFARDTPGLNEIEPVDFNYILKNRVFDYWIIINYPLLYQNESYIMTINGLHYSRFFMSHFIGEKTTDAFHEFAQRLHALNITHVEHSLLIPIVLCLPDKQLGDAENIHIIKYCYMYALYIQMCTTRTEDEAKSTFDQVVQLLDTISYLHELCIKNIGELVLDKTGGRG